MLASWWQKLKEKVAAQRRDLREEAAAGVTEPVSQKSIYPDLSFTRFINIGSDEKLTVKASNEHEPQKQALRDELSRIIDNKLITTVFQPVANLKNGQLLGYEALSRGPVDSPLQFPDKLFKTATDHNMLFALEQVCRETALRTAAVGRNGYQIFININPEVIKDPSFKGGITKLLVKELGYQPQQVAFEITERQAITDFASFRRSMNHYRLQGFTIAIDDAGAGYSSLQSIAELHPDYIKIDMSLIRNIAQNPLKQALLESMVKFAAAVNSKIIAEGIETKEELYTLIKMGVHYGQGYLLGRPSPDFNGIHAELKDYIEDVNHQHDMRKKSNGLFGTTIGELIQTVPTVNRNVLVNEVEEIFNDEHINGVVVLDGETPVGLIMKHKLYYQLGKNYGVSLYQKRPVDRVMDHFPLIVDAELPVEAVSQISMSREEYSLYDLIIVIKEDRYIGVVSIMKLLNSITKLQIRCAHNSNPLTGLPGNLVIEKHLKEALHEGRKFAVLYIDLDNFKAFNDKYGFERGDKALTTTAQALQKSLSKTGHREDDFLGHIGGDDFIILSHPDNVPRLCQSIITTFHQEIKNLYNMEDRERGYIEVKSRRRQIEQFPLMTISIAVVTNQYRDFQNYLEIGEVAADLKKQAKDTPGSTWVQDRRRY